MSSLYRQAREEASKHASVRNMCFQQVRCKAAMGQSRWAQAGVEAASLRGLK